MGEFGVCDMSELILSLVIVVFVVGFTFGYIINDYKHSVEVERMYIIEKATCQEFADYIREWGYPIELTDKFVKKCSIAYG